MKTLESSCRYESWGRCVRLLWHRRSVHPWSHKLPGEKSVCGKWSCPDGPLQDLLVRWSCQVWWKILHALQKNVQILQASNPVQVGFFLSVFKYLTVFFNFFRGVGVRMVEPLYQSPSFDNILPSLVFLQVVMCTYKSDMSDSWSPVSHSTEPCLLILVFPIAEPSLCSGGSRSRASSGRTSPGYVCSARREDMSYGSTYGGPGSQPSLTVLLYFTFIIHHNFMTVNSCEFMFLLSHFI